MLFVLSIPLPLYPSIHLSIYLSFSREEKRKNSRANASRITIITIIRPRRNSSPPITIFHPSSLVSSPLEKRVAGQSLPSDVSLLLHLGYAAASGVRSIPRAPLWLVRRSRVELALLDLSETLRPDGKSPAAAEEGEKKGTKERNGYREKAGALPGKNEGGGGRRRHEAGTERFPPNNHGNNSQEWNTCQIKGLESSKVPR